MSIILIRYGWNRLGTTTLIVNVNCPSIWWGRLIVYLPVSFIWRIAMAPLVVQLVSKLIDMLICVPFVNGIICSIRVMYCVHSDSKAMNINDVAMVSALIYYD